jgi:hypothetical protein
VFTTHRYDSIPRGTTIVVLVDGRIAEIGTHEELVQRQRHYWSLWTSGRDAATRTRAVHSGRLRAAAYTPLVEPKAPVGPQFTWTAGGPAQDDSGQQRWDAIDPGEPHVR